jgi:tripartite-type tricarboxylate transporter receptor subunit TctC
VSLPNILVAHPSLPVRSVKDLVAFAKARPAQINFASAGMGTSPHLSMELLLTMTGTKMIHVPYKGSGQGVVDVLAGHVSLMTPSILTALPYVKDGRLRALGVTSAKRAAGAPDIPAIAEAGVPGYESVSWFGLAAPAAVPKDILMRLYNESVAILRTREIQERFAKDGSLVVAGTPQEFRAYIRSETVKWAKVVKSADIKPE